MDGISRVRLDAPCDHICHCLGATPLAMTNEGIGKGHVVPKADLPSVDLDHKLADESSEKLPKERLAMLRTVIASEAKQSHVF